MITVSSPGKLMLFGEHAVIYGNPCISTAIDKRMFVSLEKRKDKKITLYFPEIKTRKSILTKQLEKKYKSQLEFALKSIKIFYEKFNITNGLDVITKSRIPMYGLGTSSAVVVCMVEGLSRLFGINMSKKELFDICYKIVLEVQGVGSGFDIATAIYGGSIYFISEKKIVQQLKVKELPIIIAYTGVKSDTAKLIKFVEKKVKRYPKEMNEIFEKISSIVREARKKIEKSKWNKVGELMNENQNLLRAIGVSSQKIEEIISAALGAGAYGAKLSGAGKGDCIIAISSKKNEKEVKGAIKNAGGTIVETKTNAEGVRLEPRINLHKSFEL